jgi:Nif-specific regulatory protein
MFFIDIMKKNTCDECSNTSHINLLFKIGQSLTATDQIRNVIPAVLRFLSDESLFRKCMVTIVNRQSGEIFIQDAIGLTDVERNRVTYTIGEGITGRVVETGQPYIVPHITDEPSFLNRTGLYSKDEDLSFICLPVKIFGEVIGTISADFIFKGDQVIYEYEMLLGVVSAMIAQAVYLYQMEYEEKQKLKDENSRLLLELEQKFQPGNIVGNSRTMRMVYNLIDKVSKSDANLLIIGESGTGKELVAHAVHYSSSRAQKPYIAFNCAALSENIIESELFGHEKGSFTGALQKRLGKFEQADGGTIFLDEIGELSLVTQAKLLRILQERVFERVGGSAPIHIDVRIVAATNRDLEEMVRDGAFRADLFYRLNVFPIHVPPLRDRKGDIVLLSDYFLKKYAEKNGKTIKRISTPAIDLLMSYHWPGNVRELENCIERAVILSDDQVIHAFHLPPSLQSSVSTSTEVKTTLESAVNNIEYEMIVEALKEHKGNMSKAAKQLGLTERVMNLRVKKFNIDYKIFRP